MRRRQRGANKQRWGDEEVEESRLHGRVEASKESWRDEEAAERQSGAFEESWRDEEAAERSLQGEIGR